MKDILESIWHKLYEDADSNPEISFYWNKIIDDATAHADPKYCKSSISQHFYNLACAYGSAEKLQAFERGVQLGLQFSQLLITKEPQPTPKQLEADFKEHQEKWGNKIKFAK